MDLLNKVAQKTMQWPFRLWGFGEGIALRGLLRANQITGEGAYLGFVRSLLLAYAGHGVGRSPAEHIAPGSELLMLYERCPDPRLLEAAQALAKLHASFPKNRFGARMHRPDLSGWRMQIWVDCMDVDAPFLLRLAHLTADEAYIQQAIDEILGYARALQVEDDSPKAGLLWHGFETHCGTNGTLWARGNGWALMGLVETIRLLPSSHPARGELMERLTVLVHALSRYQSDGGLWHTVITDDGTYLESTLAVMVAWALHEAFSAGILPSDTFCEMERKARQAAHDCVGPDGSLDKVSDATPVAEHQIYATRPFGIYPWGQGPLLLMLSQESNRED